MYVAPTTLLARVTAGAKSGAFTISIGDGYVGLMILCVVLQTYVAFSEGCSLNIHAQTSQRKASSCWRKSSH